MALGIVVAVALATSALGKPLVFSGSGDAGTVTVTLVPSKGGNFQATVETDSPPPTPGFMDCGGVASGLVQFKEDLSAGTHLKSHSAAFHLPNLYYDPKNPDQPMGKEKLCTVTLGITGQTMSVDEGDSCFSQHGFDCSFNASDLTLQRR